MKKFHHTFRGAMFSLLPIKRIVLLGLFIAFYAWLANSDIVPSQAELDRIPPTVEQNQNQETGAEEESAVCENIKLVFPGYLVRQC